MKKRYLSFVEDKEYGKTHTTKRYRVYNHVSNDFLGTMHWKGAWRQYVFDDGTLELAEGCLEELGTFIKLLREERLKEKQNGK